jgi:hypothetical protein
MTTWEYQLIGVTPWDVPSGEQLLNQAGRDGWELVNIAPAKRASGDDTEKILCFLRRPLPG